MIIFVDTPHLQSKGRDILLLRDELLYTMEQIESLILSVSGSWQGDAERAYTGKILYVKKEFESITNFFHDYAELLMKISDQYTKQDEILTTKLNLM